MAEFDNLDRLTEIKRYGVVELREAVIHHNPVTGNYTVNVYQAGDLVGFDIFQSLEDAESWAKDKTATSMVVTDKSSFAIEPGRVEKLDLPEEVGKKYDKGKVKAGMVLQYFARAILAMSEVGTFGCEKYGDKKDFWDYNWTEVVHAIKRYEDAHARHTLKGYIEERDEETGFLHLAHRAWCAMATLELKLRELEVKKNG